MNGLPQVCTPVIPMPSNPRISDAPESTSGNSGWAIGDTDGSDDRSLVLGLASDRLPRLAPASLRSTPGSAPLDLLGGDDTPSGRLPTPVLTRDLLTGSGPTRSALTAGLAVGSAISRRCLLACWLTPGSGRTGARAGILGDSTTGDLDLSPRPPLTGGTPASPPRLPPRLAYFAGTVGVTGARNLAGSARPTRSIGAPFGTSPGSTGSYCRLLDFRGCLANHAPHDDRRMRRQGYLHLDDGDLAGDHLDSVVSQCHTSPLLAGHRLRHRPAEVAPAGR